MEYLLCTLLHLLFPNLGFAHKEHLLSFLFYGSNTITF